MLAWALPVAHQPAHRRGAEDGASARAPCRLGGGKERVVAHSLGAARAAGRAGARLRSRRPVGLAALGQSTLFSVLFLFF